MKLTRKLATVALIIGGVVAGFAGTATAANSDAIPAVSNTTSPTGYVSLCAVVSPAFSKTYPVLDYHGIQKSTYKCGTGHQLVTMWAGKLPAGQAGPQGPAGPTGPQGPQGEPGRNAQALPYGIGEIQVSRGTGTATTWATVSTTIGSPAPMGDQASGYFRFSCSDAQAPCKVSEKAYATTDGIKAYPRLIITKENHDTGAPMGTCEYADGTDNSGGSMAVGNGASNDTSLTLGIGGTLDCNSTQTYPTNGVANDIWVPAGFYNVDATTFFTKS